DRGQRRSRQDLRGACADRGNAEERAQGRGVHARGVTTRVDPRSRAVGNAPRVGGRVWAAPAAPRRHRPEARGRDRLRPPYPDARGRASRAPTSGSLAPPGAPPAPPAPPDARAAPPCAGPRPFPGRLVSSRVSSPVPRLDIPRTSEPGDVSPRASRRAGPRGRRRGPRLPLAADSPLPGAGGALSRRARRAADGDAGEQLRVGSLLPAPAL